MSTYACGKSMQLYVFCAYQIQMAAA